MILKYLNNRRGGMSFGGGFLMWLIGIPLPIILLISLIRGCN